MMIKEENKEEEMSTSLLIDLRKHIPKAYMLNGESKTKVDLSEYLELPAIFWEIAEVEMSEELLKFSDGRIFTMGLSKEAHIKLFFNFLRKGSKLATAPVFLLKFSKIDAVKDIDVLKHLAGDSEKIQGLLFEGAIVLGDKVGIFKNIDARFIPNSLASFGKILKDSPVFEENEAAVFCNRLIRDPKILGSEKNYYQSFLNYWDGLRKLKVIGLINTLAFLSIKNQKANPMIKGIVNILFNCMDFEEPFIKKIIGEETNADKIVDKMGNISDNWLEAKEKLWLKCIIPLYEMTSHPDFKDGLEKMIGGTRFSIIQEIGRVMNTEESVHSVYADFLAELLLFDPYFYHLYKLILEKRENLDEVLGYEDYLDWFGYADIDGNLIETDEWVIEKPSYPNFDFLFAGIDEHGNIDE